MQVVQAIVCFLACTRVRADAGCAAALRLAVFGFTAVLLSAPPLRADPPGELHGITLEGKPDGCLSERSLRARVAHYLARAPSPGIVQVQVRRMENAAEFSVSQAGEIVARRRFERLPRVCADRRDTIALAIALAIEHAAAREQAAKEPAADGDPSARELSEAEAARTSVPEAGREAAAAPSAAIAPSASAKASVQGAVAEQESTAAQAAATTEREHHARPPASGEGPAEDARVQPRGSKDRAGAVQSSSFVARLTHTALQAGVRATFAVLPAPAVVFSAGAELPLAPRFRVQLAGLASIPVHSALAPARVRSRFFGGEALGCGRAGPALLSVHGCLGLGGGALIASGDGYTDDRDTTLGWMAALLRVALRWSLTRLAALQLAAGGHVNLIRPELRLLGSENADRGKLGGGSLGLDMIVAFR